MRNLRDNLIVMAVGYNALYMTRRCVFMRYRVLLTVLMILIGVIFVRISSSHAQAVKAYEYKVILGQYMTMGAIQSGIQGALNEQGQSGWEFLSAVHQPSSVPTYVLIFRKER